MPRPSDKTLKIRAAIAKGTPAVKIAETFGVSSQYVYSLRKRLQLKPAARVVRKTKKQSINRSISAPAPAPAPVVLAHQMVSPEPRPAIEVMPPVPPVSLWGRIKSMFGAAR